VLVRIASLIRVAVGVAVGDPGLHCVPRATVNSAQTRRIVPRRPFFVVEPSGVLTIRHPHRID